MKSKLFILILIFVFAELNTAIGQNTQKDLTEIINKQQAMLDEMQAEIDDLKSYVEEDEDDMFGDINIHGFISQGFLKSENDNWFMDNTKGQGSFQFNEVGINFSSQLSDNLRVGAQFLSRDFGAVDNNKVKIDWAYFDYKFDDWLGFRAGKMKTPIGLYSEIRDVDMLRTTIFLPFMRMYDESYREMMNAIQGISLYGSLDVGVAGMLDYNVQWGYNDINTEDGGMKRQIEGISVGGVNPISEAIDGESESAFASRINWSTPIDGLLLGGAYGKYKSNATVLTSVPLSATLPAGSEVSLNFTDYHVYIASAQYTIGELVLTSEYQRAKYDADFAGIMSTSEETQMWYMMADYRLNSLLSLAVGYSNMTDAGDPDGEQAEAAGGKDYSTWTKDWFVSSKFDITENWVFKAELHFLDGTDYNMPNMKTSDQERRDVLLALKTTVSF